LYLLRLSKVSFKSSIWLLFSCGDDYVIDVYLDVLTYLASEAILHHPLIGCFRVLEAERHDLVTKDAIWCDKAVFSLSSFFNLIWLYPKYASRKVSLAHPVVESIIWSMRGSGKGSLG
jgi:hypothetical protein